MRTIHLAKYFFVPTLFISIFLFQTIIAVAQSKTDSSIYHESLTNTVQYFKKSIKENLHLFEGDEYVYPPSFGQKIFGFPYYFSDGLLPGSIYYNGQFYDNVMMRFDLLNEKVVIIDPYFNVPIELHNEKIDSFFIDQHEFIQMTPRNDDALHTNRFFYERLYNGKEILWSIHEKKLMLSAKAEEQSANYVQYDQYYLQKDSVFFGFDGKKKLLSLLSDKKSELKKFIRKNKLKFKTGSEKSFIKIIQYYDQIKKLQ